MLGSILIALGVLIAIGTMLIGTYLINLGCSMSPQGCNQSILELIIELMTSHEGTAFWAALVIGFILISVGYTIKSSSERGG